MTLWSQVKEVFAEALEREGPAREAYLRETCGPDAELRAEVDRLLAEHDDHDDLLDNPALSVNWLSAPVPEQYVFDVGETLAGRFEIVRFIGRGGMGEVYEANDLELGDHVAIKTVLPEFTADPTGLRRFKREIQLARKVTHPNVCRIFDVAHHERDGREHTFLSMELLEGETLSEHLKTKGRLTTDEALPLVRQMAAGLDALHQAGIIHRDFKPGNVMLVSASDGQARVVVTDFGLARKAVRETGEMSAASKNTEILGTPEYMAPEQLTGDNVGPAADVYALGLVLHRMVTGRHVLEGNDPPRSADTKLEPSAPDWKLATCDLEASWQAAIARCIQYDPRDRYSSALQVVEALGGGAAESGSAGQPRTANNSSIDLAPTTGPSTRLQNEAGNANRLRLPVGAMAGLLAALLSAVLVLVVARDHWSTGSLVSNGTKHVVVLPFRCSGSTADRQAFCDGLMEVVASRLTEMELSNTALVVTPVSEVIRKDIHSAAEAQREFGAQLVVTGSVQESDKRIRLILNVVDAVALTQLRSQEILGSEANLLGLEQRAVASLVEALDLNVSDDALTAAADRGSTVPGVYELFLQGQGYLQRFDRPENIEPAVDLFESASRKDQDFAPAFAGLCRAHWYRYKHLKALDAADLAIKHCNRALELDQSLAQVHTTLGYTHSEQGLYREAVADFDRALDMDPRDVEAHHGLARAYAELGRPEEAEKTLRRAIALRPKYWDGYNRLGLFYFHQSRYRAAADQMRQAVRLTPDNIHANVNLGTMLYYSEDFAEAKVMFQRAAELDPNQHRAFFNLASLSFEEGDYAKAIDLYEQSLAVTNDDYVVWGGLADVHFTIGVEQVAWQTAYERSLGLLEQALKQSPRNPTYLAFWARYAARLGRREEAVHRVREALALAPGKARIQIQAARVYLAVGELAEAQARIEQAISLGYPEALVRRRPEFKGFGARLDRSEPAS